MGAKDIKEDLKECSSTEILDIFGIDRKQVQAQKWRDLLKAAIILLTLYWGVDRWDGPTHLHEMFGEIDENLKPFIPDYHVNLVAPNLIQDFTKFKTELGQTLEFIKYSADTPHFKKMLSELKNKKLTNETVSVINLFTGAKIELNEREEVTDVCLAIEEIKKEYAAEQVAKEIVNSIESAMKNFHVSLEEACKGLKHTVEEYEDAKKFVESLDIV